MIDMIEYIKRTYEDVIDRRADRNRTLKVAKIQRVYRREGGLIGGSLSNPGRPVCGHPGRCAIGALLVAVGVSDEDLFNKGFAESYLVGLLEDHYGLSYDQASQIVAANDGIWGSFLAVKCGLNTRPANEVRVCVGVKTVETL
jgi:hypothetical protein